MTDASALTHYRVVHARRTPWPAIIGVALIAMFAVAGIAMLASGEDDDGIGAPSGSAAASATVSAETPAETPADGPAGSATPAPSSAGSAAAVATLTVGEFVAPVIDGVNLRRTPGTAGERLGTLAQGSVNLVVEGPVDADGSTWYRLSATGLPPSSGCVTPVPTDPFECPIWYGWAAASDPSDGTPWFAPAHFECPAPDVDPGAFLMLPSRAPVGCYGADEIAFTAWYGEGSPNPPPPEACQVDPAVAWLYCDEPASSHTVWTSPEEAQAGRAMYVDPESGVTLPERGQWVRVTGVFDHPDAALCAGAEEQAADNPDPDRTVLECRNHLVVSAVEPTTGP